MNWFNAIFIVFYFILFGCNKTGNIRKENQISMIEFRIIGEQGLKTIKLTFNEKEIDLITLFRGHNYVETIDTILIKNTKKMNIYKNTAIREMRYILNVLCVYDLNNFPKQKQLEDSSYLHGTDMYIWIKFKNNHDRKIIFKNPATIFDIENQIMARILTLLDTYFDDIMKRREYFEIE